MSYKFQKGDAKLGGAIEASQLTGTLKPSSLADATTDDINEGSARLYYTDARVFAAVSAGTGLDYDSAGEFSISNGGVDTAQLAADAVDGTKLADDAVDSEHIAAGAIDFEHFAAGSVSGSALADAGIGNAKLLNSTISGIALGGTLNALSTGNGLSMTSYDGSAAVSDLTITLDGATLSVGVSGLKVADGGVDTTQLAADAVDGTKIADDSVDSEHIVDGAVDLAHLAADSVDGTKIADDSVDSEHIAAGAIDFEHFAASSVSGSALADAGVGSAKIAELDSFDTDALSEGSNLYYTDARVHAAVSAGAGLGYDGSGVFSIPNLSVSNDMLSGSIANAKLVNDSVTLTAGAGMAAIGEVALGASITVAVDGVLEDLDALGAASADGEFIVATGEGAFAYESGNTARTSLGLGTSDTPSFAEVSASAGFATPGLIQGGTVQATTYNGNSLAVTGITGSLNNALSAGAGIAAFTYDNGDGPKTVAVASTIAGDGLRWDNGVLSIGAEVGQAQNGDTLQPGYNFFGSISAAASVSLPASPAVGDLVVVKAGAGASAVNTITINPQGSHEIDGETSLVIESEYGAVSMVYVATNDWRVV